MEAGFFSVNEHTLDTTQPKLRKQIFDSSKGIDKYGKIEVGSSMFDTADSHWKPGGTMIGVSGKWASRVIRQGSDSMGRRSWMDIR